MPSTPATNIHTIPRSSISNREFMEKYARPGMVALACGDTLIDRAIAFAERHVGSGGRLGALDARVHHRRTPLRRLPVGAGIRS